MAAFSSWNTPELSGDPGVKFNLFEGDSEHSTVIRYVDTPAPAELTTAADHKTAMQAVLEKLESVANKAQTTDFTQAAYMTFLETKKLLNAAESNSSLQELKDLKTTSPQIKKLLSNPEITPEDIPKRLRDLKKTMQGPKIDLSPP